MTDYKRKLIEVALPLDAINKASAREKQPGIGAHPRGLHHWWARRPQAAARAVIFAQMVDDPSAHPDVFKTEQAQEDERERLFGIIEDMVLWENATNESVLKKARDEILASWRQSCSENAGHARAKELFDPARLPAFHDPFAGGGALPLEAQRLGLEAHASDLNPVAVLINKAMIEIPPRFAGRPPVNPAARSDKALFDREWKGAQGLAEDVRYYGQWMRSEAEKVVGDLYPKVEVTKEMAKGRPDLKRYEGRSLTVVAWLWARTVRSPNPAFRKVEVPLASTFMLSTRPGKEAYVEPVIGDEGYGFAVQIGKPKDEAIRSGTKLSRGANFRCIMSGVPIDGEHIKSEAKAGRLGSRLLAAVCEGDRQRVYLSPTKRMEEIAELAKPGWKPDGALVHDARAFTPTLYGIETWGQLFTPRQLSSLATITGLVAAVRAQVKRDALSAGNAADSEPLAAGGKGADAYSEAVSTYLALAGSRLADYNSTLSIWKASGEQVMHTFTRQALPMTWDFAESNVLADSAVCWTNCVKYTLESLLALSGSVPVVSGIAVQADAAVQELSIDKVVSTDPPYYDNVPYADLSDFFYMWLRRSLRTVFPELFSTLAVPKAEELVATSYRHGGKEGAEVFFLRGMTQAMHQLAEQCHPSFPITIYYAFKQSESNTEDGTTSTGWETFLEAVLQAGFATTGTWPMRTELGNRMRGMDSNALASSIILVCRPRTAQASTATRREFVAALKGELPLALAYLQRGNIAPVDLAQAAIGPGMAVYTRYSKVLDAEGKPLSVREALALINQTLDEALAEQEGDFDADTRFAIVWFDQNGFADGEAGTANLLANAKVTSVEGLEKAGIVVARGSKVRLLKPEELPADWDPATDPRLTAWEIVHHLVRVLASGGEGAAAGLAAKLGAKAEIARELAYRLYTLCERKKRAVEALAYNGLVQSWPEITRLAREGGKPRAEQAALFGETEE